MTSNTTSQPSIFTLGLAIFATLALTIGSLRAGEEHLPKKAKDVAEKLAAFEKTATPEAIKTKRAQVIQYLDALLKDEASKANLDGALAVKGLIQKIEATTGTTTPAQAKPEGLPLEKFSINSKSTRRLEFPFVVATDRPTKTIQCEIEGASDDSGDLGLEYELIDPKGKVAKRGKLLSSGPEKISHQTRLGGDWKIVLIDKDTEFGGNYPGNNGTLRVTIKRAATAVAANR